MVEPALMSPGRYRLAVQVLNSLPAPSSYEDAAGEFQWSLALDPLPPGGGGGINKIRQQQYLTKGEI